MSGGPGGELLPGAQDGCFPFATFPAEVKVMFFFLNLFLAALGLRCCVRIFLWLRPAAAPLPCSAGASHCGGFSCCGAWPLECRLHGCGTWASLPCGMWNLPWPGFKPFCPALADGFITAEPPGQSVCFLRG